MFGEDGYFFKLLHKIAVVLLVIGALNWGLVGAFRINLVDRLLGKGSGLSRAVYVLVGIAALGVAFNRDTYLPFLYFPALCCRTKSPREPPEKSRFKPNLGLKLCIGPVNPPMEEMCPTTRAPIANTKMLV